MKIHEHKHGLEIIEGLMGSGKTYFAVKRVLKVIKTERRVVYTNLPLKLRVVRKRLASLGGKELADLIQPLTEEHWRRYLRRHRKYAQLREQFSVLPVNMIETEILQEIAEANAITLERIQQMPKLHSNHLRAWFELENGPNIYQGPEANEIPPYAVIVIDEVQNWHSMIDQSKDPDRVNLLEYITKSRHSVHWVWVITQDARNISIEFRRLAGSIWKVWQRGEDRLAWGMRYRHFGLRATAYKRYTHEQWEMKDKFGDESAESFMIMTTLPWNRRNYRYYHPYTNSGSQRQLERQLKKARHEAGLTDTGQTQEEYMKSIHKVTFAQKIVGWMLRKIKIVIMLGVAFLIGLSIAKSPKQTTEQEVSTVDTPTETEIQWPKWTIAGTTPWIDGKKLSAGDFLANGSEFLYVDPAGDSLVLSYGGAFWLWEYGHDTPERIAPIEDVRNAVASAEYQNNGIEPTVPDETESLLD